MIPVNPLIAFQTVSLGHFENLVQEKNHKPHAYKIPLACVKIEKKQPCFLHSRKWIYIMSKIKSSNTIV